MAVDLLRSDVRAQLDGYAEVLRGLRGLFEAESDVSRGEFSAYLTSSDALARFPGKQAIEWAPLVNGQDLGEYVKSVRSDTSLFESGHSDFEVKTQGTPDQLIIVDYVVPMEGNEAAFGFDLASNPARLEAIEETRESRQPFASAPIELVQETESQVGMLLLQAVFNPNLSDEPDGFAGVVLAVFRLGDLLGTIPTAPGLSFVVTDVGSAEGTADERVTLFASTPDATPSADLARVEVNGRIWEVALAVGTIPDASLVLPIVGAGTGLLAAAAIALVVWLIQQSGARAESLAASLTSHLSRANEELEITSSRLASAVGSAQVGLWERNIDTGARWVSDGFAAMLGDEPETWAGPGVFAERLHPDDRADVLEGRSAEADRSYQERTFRLRHADGTYRWVLSRSRVVDSSSGSVRVGAHIDMTEIHLRVAEIERLNEDLVLSNQKMRDFTHVASHDLRSPLRAIAALVGFVREDAISVGDDVNHNLTRIEQRVARMNTLIDDLLVYSRAGSDEGQQVLTDVRGLFQSIIETVDIPTGFTVDVQCSAGHVVLERTAFELCLRNLVDNAIQHHDSTSGTVTISASVSGNCLVCGVRDDGPGIEAKYHDTVFLPFRRLNPEDPTPGSGIGLAVVARTVSSHGATIHLDSESGAGAVFEIRWPIGQLNGEGLMNERQERREREPSRS